jgi:DNA-binding SARP family transcriptional activator/tetratricopeptide (TPR) repeat protein
MTEPAVAEPLAEVRFGVLGALQVVDGWGASRVIPAGKLRVLLATLLLGNGSTVSAMSLTEALWDESPPPNAAAALRTYVTRLRRALGPVGARIVGRSPGWAVELHGPGELDLAEVEWLWQTARTAAAAGEWQQTSSLLATALSLWRGEPLVDVPSPALVRREAASLAELRLRLAEARIDADLRLDRDRDLVPELRRLAAEHPLREHVRAQLMLACYRSGQQAAALEVYRDARSTLAEELGVEPGPELRDLHQKILAADPDLTAAAGDAFTTAAPAPGQPQRPEPEAVVPRQLPAAVRIFTGREAELTLLTDLTDRARADGSGVIIVISGMAGVGKTALAVNWARRSAGLFPDGQLHVNLHGYTPSGEPVDPAAVITGFLEALGVPASQIPASAQAQAGLYRSLLAGRNMLIVLDNARDAPQVRPLLPGAPGCLVLVTAREQLTGLAATDGAHMLSLDVLRDAEAVEMLVARLDADRAASQPGAVAEMASLCGNLPLALAVTAARAAARPGHQLSALAAELREAGGRLDALDDADAASSIRAVFSWSYGQLSPAAARAFRLLGLHPGPDISAPAVASLAGLSRAQARNVIADLTRAHLLAEPAPGRYAFHDLLRAYASEQVRASETPEDRHAAQHRTLDHYLATAVAAAKLLITRKLGVALPPLAPGVRPEELTSRDAALGWLTAEYAVLLRLTDLAAETGFDHHAWQLPREMWTIFIWRAQWQDWDRTHRVAEAAAYRLGDKRAQAITLMNWSGLDMERKRANPAEQRLRRALGLFGQIGDRQGQATALVNLGWLLADAGRDEEAIRVMHKVYRLSSEIGDCEYQLGALVKIGQCRVRTGEHRAAAGVLVRAQRMLGQQPEDVFHANAAHSLGQAFYGLGDYRQAISSYQASAELSDKLGDHPLQAEALNDLADAYSAEGRHGEAVRACEQTLSILTDLGHPDAFKTRSKLEKLKAEAGAVVGRA